MGKNIRIKAAQCLAFDDNDNDFMMIEYAGLTIVVINGCDTVKAVADYIIDTAAKIIFYKKSGFLC